MSVLNSLFVGIDVSKNSNQVYAMNFDEKKLLSFSSPRIICSVVLDLG